MAMTKLATYTDAANALLRYHLTAAEEDREPCLRSIREFSDALNSKITTAALLGKRFPHTALEWVQLVLLARDPRSEYQKDNKGNPLVSGEVIEVMGRCGVDACRSEISRYFQYLNQTEIILSPHFPGILDSFSLAPQVRQGLLAQLATSMNIRYQIKGVRRRWNALIRAGLDIHADGEFLLAKVIEERPLPASLLEILLDNGANPLVALRTSLKSDRFMTDLENAHRAAASPP
jgi:hypothetical protein